MATLLMTEGAKQITLVYSVEVTPLVYKISGSAKKLLKLTKYRDSEYSDINNKIRVKKHNRWCGVGKTDRIGYHVTT